MAGKASNYGLYHLLLYKATLSDARPPQGTGRRE
jgi:hypothetical protein